MRYIGSKTSTLPWLESFVARMAPDATSLCDPFAGTCTVSRHFKRLGFRIFTGDVLSLSQAMQVATIGLNRRPDFRSLSTLRAIRSRCEPTTLQRVFAYLNALEPEEGYLSKHFSRAAGRMFFTDANAMKIDAIRAKISDWEARELLSPSERQFLLASLLVASDRVANTAGTYYAHLKQVSRKAAKEVHLVPFEIFNNGHANICRIADAREVAAKTAADLLYLDPPYNERDYGGYYHLPETIVRGESPIPAGRSGAPSRRPHPRSDLCRPERAAGALAEVVRGAQSRYILVHYAREGLVPHGAIMDMLADRGRVSYRDLQVRAYSSQEDDAGCKAIHRIYWCRTAGRTS
ncbi:MULTISPECIES: DNA adenine methylase [Bradyrhizobium]|uniref:DNA adenine methylase n=1 Tax=Bradyrhizobium TaxID=374 RepID=UPI000401212F|nr:MULTISPECIES: DNA adenine methylase [Bradyrhizobium]MBR1002978.1 DNA adenine methylase [Bradyrhizobium liaoningense]MCP1749164.1 adenine-specific DNA-methyltransferase [Bradyrhizobium japonicum]MCP1855184.1 adenine-specific DNA-methyltransferase [Bradyrhizobium japonicum]MCP1898067.1 adenine-specific DNA-methyltransferase [Bradyrhizobium japonicum]MCW2331000.1 adenine-specific DNA-methyltransferase [Bradyrhizobium japonicum]